MHVDFVLRTQYLRIDFPMWIKYLPFEEHWQSHSLNDNVRALLANTQEILEKAKRANLTLEGWSANEYPVFPLRDWLPWLIEGTREMNVNHVKRSYLELTKNTLGIPQGLVQLKPHVLDPSVLKRITQEIRQLCP